MENLFKLNSNENIAEEETKYYEKIIMEPYYHINENRGRDFRNRLIEVYNYWLKLDKTELELVIDFAQLIHTADLLMDDIQDSSELRRGNPAAHMIYNVGRCIVAIDFSFYMYYLGKVIKQSTEFLMVALNCVLKALEGQTMEIYWRDNFICPREEEYFDMTGKKTGYLILAIVTYMQLFSKTKINVKKLTVFYGMYFQISDDYKGLTSKVQYESKGFCDEIREGKFTFPVIHAIKSRPNDTRILDILKMHTTDINVRKNCLQLLEDFGSLEYTRNKIIYIKNVIIQEMKQLGFNDSFKVLYDMEKYDL